jgi:hypothetical protein
MTAPTTFRDAQQRAILALHLTLGGARVALHVTHADRDFGATRPMISSRSARGALPSLGTPKAARTTCVLSLLKVRSAPAGADQRWDRQAIRSRIDATSRRAVMS